MAALESVGTFREVRHRDAPSDVRESARACCGGLRMRAVGECAEGGARGRSACQDHASLARHSHNGALLKLPSCLTNLTNNLRM